MDYDTPPQDDDNVLCPYCNGDGKIILFESFENNDEIDDVCYETCTVCDGEGTISKQKYRSYVSEQRADDLRS